MRSDSVTVTHRISNAHSVRQYSTQIQSSLVRRTMLFEVFLFGNVLCVASFSSRDVGKCCKGGESWDCDEHSSSNRVCEQAKKREKLASTALAPHSCYKSYECCEWRLATCAGKKPGVECYNWIGSIDGSGNKDRTRRNRKTYLHEGGTCQSYLISEGTSRSIQYTCVEGATHEMQCSGSSARLLSFAGESTLSHHSYTHLPMVPSSFTHPSSPHTHLLAICGTLCGPYSTHHLLSTYDGILDIKSTNFTLEYQLVAFLCTQQSNIGRRRYFSLFC